MSTKSKSTKTTAGTVSKAMPKKAIPKAVPVLGLLESRLNGAIELLSANKVDKALSEFEAIAAEAIAADNFAMARVAKSYIVHNQKRGVASADADPIHEAVFLLNDKQTDAAMEKVDKILKKEKANAQAHYLKSLVYAKTQQIELASESLKRAAEIDPDVIHIYRLEPEFKNCRKSSIFACFEED
jgi:tetratricopeptide (TPR) repeat protein